MLGRFSRVKLCVALWTGLLCPWDSLGKNTAAGGHTLLQEIFLAQESNLGLLCLLRWQAGVFTTSTTWEALNLSCLTQQ